MVGWWPRERARVSGLLWWPSICGRITECRSHALRYATGCMKHCREKLSASPAKVAHARHNPSPDHPWRNQHNQWRELALLRRAAAARGRAFGFDGAMDMLGAVIGPAIAQSLVGVLSLRHIFLLAFIPGAITVLIVIFVFTDTPRKPQPSLKLGTSRRELPRPFWRYASAVESSAWAICPHTPCTARRHAPHTRVRCCSGG